MILAPVEGLRAFLFSCPYGGCYRHEKLDPLVALISALLDPFWPSLGPRVCCVDRGMVWSSLFVVHLGPDESRTVRSQHTKRCLPRSPMPRVLLLPKKSVSLGYWGLLQAIRITKDKLNEPAECVPLCIYIYVLYTIEYIWYKTCFIIRYSTLRDIIKYS